MLRPDHHNDFRGAEARLNLISLLCWYCSFDPLSVSQLMDVEVGNAYMSKFCHLWIKFPCALPCSSGERTLGGNKWGSSYQRTCYLSLKARSPGEAPKVWSIRGQLSHANHEDLFGWFVCVFEGILGDSFNLGIQQEWPWISDPPSITHCMWSAGIEAWFTRARGQTQSFSRVRQPLYPLGCSPTHPNWFQFYFLFEEVLRLSPNS